MNPHSLVHLPLDPSWSTWAVIALAIGSGLILGLRRRSWLAGQLGFLAELPALPRLLTVLFPLGLLGALLWMNESREFLGTLLALFFCGCSFFWGRLALGGLAPILRWGPGRRESILPWLPLGALGLAAALFSLPISAVTLALALSGLQRTRVGRQRRSASGLALGASCVIVLSYAVAPLRPWSPLAGSAGFALGITFEVWRRLGARAAARAQASPPGERPRVIIPVPAAQPTLRAGRLAGVKRLLRVS